MRSFFLTPRVLVCVTGLVLSVPSYAFLGGLAGSLGALTKAIPGTAAIPSPAAQAVAGNCGEPGALPTANNACAPAASAAAMLLKKTRPPEQLDSLLHAVLALGPKPEQGHGIDARGNCGWWCAQSGSDVEFERFFLVNHGFCDGYVA